jgi:putative tryptophan/tyrosine transport system substrate-binding protein
MNLQKLAIALMLLAAPLVVQAQPARLYRVGVIHPGGPYHEAIAGLKDGLKDLGLEDGKQYVLQERDAKGDLYAVEAIARSLETEKVDLICSFTTSVTLSAKRATKSVPIVFHSGTDPVTVGLVKSFRRPGGRLTGVNSQLADLTAKRLEILKELVPRLRRVMVFYNPDNPAALESLKDARAAARQLKVTIVEQPIHSVDELREALPALRSGEIDAYFHVSDALTTSHADLIIEAAHARRLPTIFNNRQAVVRGALASYGLSYYITGRLTAKYVQRVLLGANPADLPVEQNDRLQLIINLKTAKTIGLTIPPKVLARADEIIQ